MQCVILKGTEGQCAQQKYKQQSTIRLTTSNKGSLQADTTDKEDDKVPIHLYTMHLATIDPTRAVSQITAI